MKDDNLNVENVDSTNIEFDVQKLILILKKKWYWIPISIIVSIIGISAIILSLVYFNNKYRLQKQHV